MDDKDKKILNVLQEEGDLTTRQISKKTGIPLATVFKRIKSLKEKKIIKKFTIELDYEQLGKPLAAYILISVDIKHLKEKKRTQQDVQKDLKKIQSVDRVDIVTGTDDLIVHARMKNTEELNKILLEEIQSIQGISATRTSVVISEN